MNRRSPGHPQNTLCDAFRSSAFYYATALEAFLEFGCDINPAFLHRLFAPGSIKAIGTSPWYRYRNGESLPGPGTYKIKGFNLVEAVGKRYPGVPIWLKKPLFAFSDTRELTIPQIHAWMLRLEPPVGEILISQLDENTICRWYRGPSLLTEELLEIGTLEALAGLIGLIREAHLLQHFDAHKIFYEGMCKLLPIVEKDPVMSALSAEFSWHLKELFKEMWVLIPGLYYENPERTHALYRGALAIPVYPQRRIRLNQPPREESRV